MGGGPIRLVVDVANVMGSRPDGWWRDRAGAATRLLAELAPLLGTEVEPPGGGGPLRLDRIVGVVEGRARSASAPPGVEVVVAPADGDSSIVDVAARCRATPDAATAGGVLVVTADRGLRARLPAGVAVAGPGWLLDLVRR